MILKVPVDSWKENPERLLTQAYKSNYDWCVNYVLRNKGSEADAADVFQESISVAWFNLRVGKFQGDAERFNAYIRQICKYKWINQLRSAAANGVSIRKDLSDLEEMAEEDPGVDDSIKSALLLDSFADLGEKCRDLLSRFYYKKESLATIAQVMDTTVSSMKTIKYRCMMRLRKAYLERSKENE